MNYDQPEEKTEKKDMTVREAGRLGGNKVKELFGHDFYSNIGHLGGSKTKERHGNEFYSMIGGMGGRETKRRKGPEFYESIGRKGGNRVKELIQRAKDMEAAAEANSE